MSVCGEQGKWKGEAQLKRESRLPLLPLLLLLPSPYFEIQPNQFINASGFASSRMSRGGEVKSEYPTAEGRKKDVCGLKMEQEL
jgi:hypothetical protein